MHEGKGTVRFGGRGHVMFLTWLEELREFCIGAKRQPSESRILENVISAWFRGTQCYTMSAIGQSKFDSSSKVYLLTEDMFGLWLKEFVQGLTAENHRESRKIGLKSINSRMKEWISQLESRRLSSQPDLSRVWATLWLESVAESPFPSLRYSFNSRAEIRATPPRRSVFTYLGILA